MIAGSNRRAVGAVAVTFTRPTLPGVPAALVAGLAVAWSAANAAADQTSWNSPSGGTFSSAANWTAGVPDNSDAALFNNFFTIQTVQFTHSAIVGRLEVGKGLINFGLGTKTLKAVGTADGQPSLRVGSLPDSLIFLNLKGGWLAAKDAVIGDAEGCVAEVWGLFDSQASRMVFEDLTIGRLGYGVLFGGAWGTIDAASLTLGEESGALGEFFAGAFDSVTTVTGDCVVGAAGTGTMLIGSEATMTVNGNLTAAVEAGSSAKIRCSDELGVLHVLGDGAWGIGGTTEVVCANGGRIVVDGSLTASSSASIGIEVGPNSLDDGAAIDVGGTLELFLGETDAGSLPTPVTVTLTNGFIPEIGAVAPLLRSGNATEWPLVTLPPTTVSRRYEVVVTPNAVDLQVFAGSGDLNGDNAIDAADLALLLAAWSSGEVDLNGDTMTDAIDLGLLLGAFEIGAGR